MQEHFASAAKVATTNFKRNAVSQLFAAAVCFLRSLKVHVVR